MNLIAELKLDYNLFYQFGDGKNYDHGYKYNPNGINPYEFSNQTHIVGLRYSIGDNSFANLSYSFLDDQSDSFLYDDVSATGTLDGRYVAPSLDFQQGANAFAMGGIICTQVKKSPNLIPLLPITLHK